MTTTTAVQRGEQLIDALRQAREQEAPLTVEGLAARVDPPAAPDEVVKTLGKKPYSAQVIVADKKDPQSPIALADDLTRLADSPLLVEFALERICTPGKELQPLNKVAGKVDKALRPTFTESLERRAAEGTLPGSVGVQTVRDKPHFYLERLPPPPPPRPPAEVLAEKLVRVLESQKALGEGSYPVPLSHLLGLTDPQAKSTVVKKALTQEPFAGRAVPIVATKKESLICLRDDAGQAATGPRALEFAVAQLSTDKKPAHPVEKVVELVAEPHRDAFREALQRRIDTGTLPESVAFASLKGKPHLHLKRYPIPRPADEELADRLMQELRSHKERGGQAYPPTLAELLRETGTSPEDKVVGKALKKEPFKSGALAAVEKRSDTPVALAEDKAALVESPRLLEMALTAARTEDTQIVPAEAVKKFKLTKDLKDPFAAAIDRRTASGSLPEGLGCLWIKRKPHLFFLRDIGKPPSTPPAPAETREAPPAPAPEPAPPPVPTTPPGDFMLRFDEAFERLDRQAGSNNSVSLVDLRRALPFPREVFDAELRRLREADRYTLSGDEGRHGIGPEEQEAAIREGESLLLFVKRISP
jgi:hypothetical protein